MAMNASACLAQRLQTFTRSEILAISDWAGVGKMGIRARAGRRITATAHMRICIAVGLDAVTAKPNGNSPRADVTVAWWLVAATLFLTRCRRRLDIRSASDLVGVSTATLSRAEQGKPVAVESFLHICKFAGLPPASFLCFTRNMNCNTLDRRSFGKAPLGTHH